MTRVIQAVFLFLATAVAVIAAQPPSAGQGGFVPIDQLPTAESFPAAPLVIAAYAFAWLAVLVYVFSVWRRLNRVERELRDVIGRLERGARR